MNAGVAPILLAHRLCSELVPVRIRALLVVASEFTKYGVTGAGGVTVTVELVGLTTYTGGASLPFREPAIAPKSTERRVWSITFQKWRRTSVLLAGAVHRFFTLIRILYVTSGSGTYAVERPHSVREALESSVLPAVITRSAVNEISPCNVGLKFGVVPVAVVNPVPCVTADFTSSDIPRERTLMLALFADVQSYFNPTPLLASLKFAEVKNSVSVTTSQLSSTSTNSK